MILKAGYYDLGSLSKLDSRPIIARNCFELYAVDCTNLILTDTEGLELTPRGLAKTDENGMTSIPGLFASGDVVKGAKTVVEAVEQAKRTVVAMDRYLKAKVAAEKAAQSAESKGE